MWSKRRIRIQYERYQKKGNSNTFVEIAKSNRGRDRYANNTERVKEINRAARERSQREVTLFIQEYLSDKACVDCSENDMTVLTFDHVRGEKKYNISNMITKGAAIETIKRKLEKTDVVCFNCHMRREQARRGYSRFGRFLPK